MISIDQINLLYVHINPHQSVNQSRFLAREHGLVGKTNLEAAQADEIVDTISDATEKQYNAFLFEKVDTGFPKVDILELFYLTMITE